MTKPLVALSLGIALALPAVVEAQAPLGEEAALGRDRITQAQITSGALSTKDIRKKGMEIFSTPFNLLDGWGDGPLDRFELDKTSPGNRPSIGSEQTHFMRVNGMDTQSCLECHSVLSMATIPATFTVGGAGGINNVAMPGATEFDVDDSDGNGFAAYNGRVINPPFVFGAGGVELVGKEMTMELQTQLFAAQFRPDVALPLQSKGVSFGSIRYDSKTLSYDFSGVEGIDDDLVVKPFGRKGCCATIRAFDVGALQFHQGMQPTEVVGASIDEDGDGVVDEILPGELSAMHIFSTALEPPKRVKGGPVGQQGSRLFERIGCTDCHVPTLNTDFRMLPIAFPEVDTDPTANVFYTVDLTDKPTRFPKNNAGGVRVNMYSDLKRHDMGAELAETTGSDDDALFITARLWGVADTAPYLHDGRATTLTEAIAQHGGEGLLARDNYLALPAAEQLKLLSFLRTLRTPKQPSKDILSSARP